VTHEIEYELTFLAKELPPGLDDCPREEIVDIFLPTTSRHPVLRIRKRGEECKITKKYPVKEGDSSVMHEFTTPLTKEEYDELAASVTGKRFRKIRYRYEEDGVAYEVDVYQDALQGLVVVDAESSRVAWARRGW